MKEKAAIPGGICTGAHHCVRVLKRVVPLSSLPPDLASLAAN